MEKMKINMMDILSDAAKKEKGQFIYQETQKTYGQVLQAAKQLSKNLNALTKGKLVGIYLANSITFVECFFAVHSTGKRPVLISMMETAHTLKTIVEDVDISLLITDSKRFQAATETCSKVKQHLVVFNIEEEKVYDNENMCELQERVTQTDIEELAAIIKTSGTTGNQKYVMLTTEGVLENARAHIESVSFSASEKTLVMLPMCFGYCFSSQLTAHILINADIIVYEGRFECKKFVEVVNKYQITNTTIVPSMITVLSMYLKRYPNQLKCLRKVMFGGMSISNSTLEQLYKQMPDTTFIETYGQTEHSPRISTKVHFSGSKCSVGKPIRGVEIKISESVNGVGEICVKSNYIMKGYYGNESLTNETIRDGYLCTGDLGYIDESGELYIVGRKKNIIIRNGINISPEEIEKVIGDVDGVLQTVVVANKVPVIGESPVAKVVIDEKYDFELVKKQIITACKEKLPEYKQPDKLEFVCRIPTTHTGKVKRV